MTTYSQGLRLAEPTPGDPAVANIWGTILNTNFTLIDTSITGTLSLDVSGGSNVVLTANNGSPDQSRNANFVFTGTLTGNIYVLFPEGGAGSFSVQNATTGGFSLSIAVNNGSSAPAGASVQVPQNGTLELVSDGTDVRNRVDIIGLGAAASGANSDITSLSGLTTPLSPAQGGTGSTGAAGGGLTGTYPNPGISGSVKNLRMESFTVDGTFMIPTGATSDTVFKFTVVGGGAGGGGGYFASASTAGNGGGAGGVGVAFISGFSPGDSVSVSIGAGGSGGAGGPGRGPGGNGTDSTIVFDNETIITASGGLGNETAGTFSTNIGSTGLSLIGSYSMESEYGADPLELNPAGSASLSGKGGSTPYGAGGASVLGSGTGGGVTGRNGVFGGGGSGGAGTANGGIGGNGIVIIEWVL